MSDSLLYSEYFLSFGQRKRSAAARKADLRSDATSPRAKSKRWSILGDSPDDEEDVAPRGASRRDRQDPHSLVDSEFLS